jgi:hypothetical protein
MFHRVTRISQGSLQYILEGISPHVSDMGIVVNRGTAAVQTDFIFFKGNKVLGLPSV